MNIEESPATIIARFLRANGYIETLETFLKEANLPDDTGSIEKNALTIEQILLEKRLFDVDRAFEKLGVEEENTGWTVSAPSVPTIVENLPSAANILHVGIEAIRGIEQDTSKVIQVLLATAADRSTSLISPAHPHSLLQVQTPLSDSPILCATILRCKYLLTTSMSGKLVLSSLQTGEILSERKDHQKYVVKVTTYIDEESKMTWVATAAWDAKVLLYQISNLEDSSSGTDGNSSHSIEERRLSPSISQPLASLTLPSNPESILFLTHPEIATPVLLLSRRDSTFLWYYTITESTAPAHASSSTSTITSTDNLQPTYPYTLTYLGRQNLAPNSNAWVAYTPSSFALSPRDPNILAIATSSVPHMKLFIVRLLLPPPPPSASASSTVSNTQSPTEPTNTSQNSTLHASARGRIDLALQDRETAAILVQMNTLAPQTPYSTPALAWRPDGTGVWVNGDDGAVRGIEATTGKIVMTLREGHEAGSKVRCLAGGWVDVDEGDGGERKREEILVSGGFDRRLVVWKVGEK